jgi:sodium/potassium-transporting ATPase subunit alpha
VFSAGDFKVDNSSLTGESEPQERVPRNDQRNPLEATNLAFNGTLCVAGDAYGVVIRTGDGTVLGQIANLTQGEAKRDSPLSQEIDQFVKLISIVAITTSITFFIVAVARGDRPINPRLAYALNFAIGVLVAYIFTSNRSIIVGYLKVYQRRFLCCSPLQLSEWPPRMFS